MARAGTPGLRRCDQASAPGFLGPGSARFRSPSGMTNRCVGSCERAAGMYPLHIDPHQIGRLRFLVVLSYVGTREEVCDAWLRSLLGRIRKSRTATAGSCSWGIAKSAYSRRAANTTPTATPACIRPDRPARG